jgi:hypothetical protein
LAFCAFNLRYEKLTGKIKARKLIPPADEPTGFFFFKGFKSKFGEQSIRLENQNKEIIKIVDANTEPCRILQAQKPLVERFIKTLASARQSYRRAKRNEGGKNFFPLARARKSLPQYCRRGKNFLLAPEKQFDDKGLTQSASVGGLIRPACVSKGSFTITRRRKPLALAMGRKAAHSSFPKNIFKIY